MSITAEPYPDHISAIMAWLRERPEGNAIKSNLPVLAELDKRPAGYAVLVLGVGGPGKDIYLPTYSSTIELRFYGPDKRTATLLARTLLPLIMPEWRNGFVRRGCVVLNISSAGGWNELQEPDGTWFIRQPALVRWKTRPVSAERTVN
jgi:hypothetical protein